MKNEDFNRGIWTSVQFLVISHNMPELAKQLIKEAGLSGAECLWCQAQTEFEDEKMYEFLNTIFK